MQIEFPTELDYEDFYQFTLRELIKFKSNRFDNDLFIKLSNTNHMTPSVVCDFACYLNLLTQNDEKSVHLMFGMSQKLASFLIDSQFFLCLSRPDRVTTDLLSLTSNRENSGKFVNTNKINMLSVPHNPPFPYGLPPKRHLPYPDEILITKMVSKIFDKSKGLRMIKYGVGAEDKLFGGYIQNAEAKFFGGYIQIIENSYSYACSRNIDEKRFCFFTFQNYKATGLQFANSDFGEGFYGMFEMRCELLKKFSNCEDNKIEPPVLFTTNEFDTIKQNETLGRLTAMLEGITLRISKKDNCGFKYIFNNLILSCGGKLIVHSDNVLLEIDESFLNEYYYIEEGKINGYNRDRLRSIVYDDSRRSSLEQKSALRVYNYSFPGVHMSYLLCPERG